MKYRYLMMPLAALGISLSGAAHAQDKLVVAADIGFPPYFLKDAQGNLEGISVDILNYVSKQLGRSDVEIIDQEFSGIIVGLNAEKYEFVAAPTHITAARAENVLFTEPFQEADLAVLTLASGPRYATMDDLREKSIAVVRGSATDAFLTQREAEYKWKVVRYGKTGDAVQAVLSGREQAHIAGEASIIWAAKRNPALRKDVTLPTGFFYGFMFRNSDVEGRNRVEAAIECMKAAGVLAASQEKWFGEKPREDSVVYKPLPGYGAETFKGYDPTPHEMSCK